MDGLEKTRGGDGAAISQCPQFIGMTVAAYFVNEVTMDRLSYGERKALAALRSYGRIVWRRLSGAEHSRNGGGPLAGFSVEDVESLVDQGFAKRTQVAPHLVFRVTGPGMGAEF